MAEGERGFKSIAAPLTSLIVVLSFIAIGAVDFAANAERTAGIIHFPDSWIMAMNSLASAALGYLIGRNRTPPGYSQAQLDAALNTPVPAPNIPPGAPPADDPSIPPVGKQGD